MEMGGMMFLNNEPAGGSVFEFAARLRGSFEVSLLPICP
jgi:hypothetical protein